MGKDVTAVEDMLDRLEKLGDDEGQASVGNVLDTIGGRGFGPLLFVPALLEITPLGGIPGFPTFLALLIAIVAVQIVIGRDHVWVPDVIENRSVEGEKLRKAAKAMRGVGAWMDRRFAKRLTGLTGQRAQRAAALVSLLLCAMVPPLELIPFASTAPMAAIAAFGLAITARDGVLMGLGFALTGVAGGVGIWALAA